MTIEEEVTFFFKKTWKSLNQISQSNYLGMNTCTGSEQRMNHCPYHATSLCLAECRPPALICLISYPGCHLRGICMKSFWTSQALGFFIWRMNSQQARVLGPQEASVSKHTQNVEHAVRHRTSQQRILAIILMTNAHFQDLWLVPRAVERKL